MATANVIEFENVSKRFVLNRDKQDTIQGRFAKMLRRHEQGEEFWALRDVSFAVTRGESLGLVGHNGAGKSTALKLMTRILEPTSGRVSMNGRVAALLELGSGFHPDLSGRENVFLNGSLLGFSRREMRAKLPEIVEFAEIGDFIDMEVKHYSSGMYTRLAFAVATAVDPEILITDEVLAVGDEAFQRKCMDRIYRFRQQGKTIIFVSHALETVRTLCDHAVWLDHGVARKVGGAGEVIDAYLADVNRREQAQTQAAGDPDATMIGTRRGTREIEFTRVELLDANGQPQMVFQTHDPLTLRMHYLAHQPIEQPVFGIGLYHESGFWINGPNTSFAGIPIPRAEGPGYVDYQIPDLPLLAGRYQVSVAVVDQTMLHTYDHHDRMYRLIVQSDHVRDRYGIVAIPGQWDWQPHER
jgi:ABC-type polysaccharide/polyol phosphate transport system ATPase subunit